MPPTITGPTTPNTAPMFGTNWKIAPKNAHSGAQGTPMISNPTSHNTPTASASSDWATNQFFSAVPVVRAWSRNSMLDWMHGSRQRSAKHKEHNVHHGHKG